MGGFINWGPLLKVETLKQAVYSPHSSMLHAPCSMLYALVCSMLYSTLLYSIHYTLLLLPYSSIHPLMSSEAYFTYPEPALLFLCPLYLNYYSCYIFLFFFRSGAREQEHPMVRLLLMFFYLLIYLFIYVLFLFYFYFFFEMLHAYIHIYSITHSLTHSLTHAVPLSPFHFHFHYDI